MAVSYSQNGVIIKNKEIDLSKLTLEYFNSDEYITLHGLTLYSSSVEPDRICFTPSINCTNAGSIKIHFEYKVDGYSTNGYSVGFGEFFTSESTSRACFSVLNSSSSLRISYGSPITNIDIPVSYTLGTRISVDININSTVGTIKIKYGNTVVANETVPTSSLVINDYRLAIGGLRFNVSEGGYCLKGECYLDSSYIMLDNVLVWGVFAR